MLILSADFLHAMDAGHMHERFLKLRFGATLTFELIAGAWHTLA